MKLTFKYILPRILVLMVTVCVSSMVYKKVYMEPELKEQGPLKFNLLEFQWHNDVLYFGESSNIWTDPADTDKRNISDMINDSLTGMRLSGIQHSAYHAGMFLPVIASVDPRSRVKHLVVTMNLRSFDQAWIYSGLEGNLRRTACFYQLTDPMYNRLCATLGFYEHKDPEKQNAAMLKAFKEDTIKVPFKLKWLTIDQWKDNIVYHLSDGKTDEEKQALAHHYVKAYAFSIDTLNNPRIHDFDRIVNECQTKGIKLYFNILSENTRYADSLVGPELTRLMRYNRDLLVRRYAAKGAIVIDNLETVDAMDFSEKNWTTEHYNQRGRARVAAKVRKAIEKNRF